MGIVTADRGSISIESRRRRDAGGGEAIDGDDDANAGDDDVDARAVVGEVVHEITVVARRYRECGLDVSGRYLARVGLLIPGGADDEHAASVERFDDGFERSRPHAGFDAQRQRHNGGDIARLDHALDPLESGDERR